MQQHIENAVDPMTLYEKGMAHILQKNYLEALGYLEHAVSLAPDNPLLHNNLGNALKNTKQFERATQHYLKALDLNPRYPQAHNNLGVLYYFQGKWEEAKKHFESAVTYFPDYADAHFNLANTLAQLQQLPSAVIHYKQCLNHYPHHHQAIHNLGISLTALGYFEEAEPYLQNALTQDPTNIEARYHLALICASTDRLKEATTYYDQVTQQDPNHANAWHNLATLLLHQGDKMSAEVAYQKAFDLAPYNITAKHMLDALAGKTNAAGAPREYVRALFDHYASSYNHQLTTQLNYQVPNALRRLVGNHAKGLDGLWKVLDLGCGTGLCGPYFRDLSETLIGVDISPKMLDIARQQKGYDNLFMDDALNYLQTQMKKEYNLVIAADVLVYFGELETLFEYVRKNLTDKGYFALSIETTTEANYQLQTTGRYAHHCDYIERLCNQQSWQIVATELTTLRTQANLPVFGALYLLQNI